jgi:hypothetical protein
MTTTFFDCPCVAILEAAIGVSWLGHIVADYVHDLTRPAFEALLEGIELNVVVTEVKTYHGPFAREIRDKCQANGLPYVSLYVFGTPFVVGSVERPLLEIDCTTQTRNGKERNDGDGIWRVNNMYGIRTEPLGRTPTRHMFTVCLARFAQYADADLVARAIAWMNDAIHTARINAGLWSRLHGIEPEGE